jgi:hypothetical protein
MKPRNNPTDKQLAKRMRGTPTSRTDPRARHDAYWALRAQGYSHGLAKRALRDEQPRVTRETIEHPEETFDEIDPDEILVPNRVTLNTLEVTIRPDLDTDTFWKAPSRDTEYTIWLDGMSSFGLRIRPSGSKSYIVMFRIRGNRKPYRLTLGKATDIPFDIAQRLARLARMEALAGNDPRGMHKSGDLLKRAKI